MEQLPRWEPADDDPVANRYVATVGYTVNTFPAGGRDAQTTAVLFNIMFVLILGIMSES
jgi:hypothetical protein